MKSSFLTLAALLALVTAQPHRQHQRAHDKRDDIVWVTETDIVWETIEITTTIWVDDDATPAPLATTSAMSAAAQFYQSQEESSSVYAAPATTTSPVYVAPAPSSTSVYIAPVTTSAYVEPAPVESTTPEATSVTTSAYIEPALVESATPNAAPIISTTYSADTSPVYSSSPSVTTCTPDAPCTGDMTYYDASAGTGACGWNNDTMTEAVVALPHELMGTQSNGNPYCGMTITVLYGGKSTKATVVDKCMGCSGDSIDLSNAAFDQLAEESVGRVSCQWYFN